jgi:hypothetical protein
MSAAKGKRMAIGAAGVDKLDIIAAQLKEARPFLRAEPGPPVGGLFKASPCERGLFTRKAFPGTNEKGQRRRFIV